MISDLITSYRRTFDGMTYQSIYPYVEVELQPLYCELWREYITNPMMEISKFDFLNPSISRSMLIMDLLDSYFLKDVHYRDKILNWYSNQFKIVYGNSNPFSDKNLPLNYVDSNYDDFVYFSSENANIQKILAVLYQISYKKFHDIYADNAYEVIGPIYVKRNSIVCHIFRNLDNRVYKIYQIWDGKVPITVDMFGHLNGPSNFKFCLEIDGDIQFEYDVLIDYLLTLLSKFTDKFNIENHIEENVKHRYFRYRNHQFVIDVTSLLDEKVPLQRVDYIDNFITFLNRS